MIIIYTFFALLVLIATYSLIILLIMALIYSRYDKPKAHLLGLILLITSCFVTVATYIGATFFGWVDSSTLSYYIEIYGVICIILSIPIILLNKKGDNNETSN